MPSLVRLAFLLSGLSVGAFGHLIMTSPVPFGVDTLNNSPLVDAKPGTSQSDFPCKQRPGVYDITTMNHMKVGDTQLLNFTGMASHGGGSCQIAVTMDAKPTIKSTWKVIQVFEGGCPISADGNDGTHPFTFEIPKGFPNGEAVLSWTWYNRIGNREIYQNCAPITVTGGADDHTLYNSLPNWYIINLPTSECSSVESTDLVIPNPGQFVLSNTAQNNKLAAATGPSCSASAAAQTSGVSGYKAAVVQNNAAYSAPAKNGDVTGSAQGGASATDAPSASSAITTAAAQVSDVVSQATTGSSAAGGLASVPTQVPVESSVNGVASAPIQPSGTAFPTTSVAASAGVSGPGTGAASASAPVGTGSVSGGGSSGGGSQGSTGGSGSSNGTCSGSGSVVCNGPNQFGLCNNGAVVWQAVAPGTTCSNGQITRRSVLRDTRFRRRIQNAYRESLSPDVAAHTFD